MTVWNTIDDRFSNVVLYIETKQHFLLLPLFHGIFSMTVWNTIDDRYSIFFLLYRNDAYFTNVSPVLRAFSL